MASVIGDGGKKSLGNQAFKEGKFELAAELYTAAIDENVDNIEGLKAVLCNRSACSLKLQKFQDCIDDSSAAIELDRRYVKAYYRRAQAHLELKDSTAAAKDLKLVLSIDPSNKEAVLLMREVAKLVQVKAAEDSEINRVLGMLQEGKEIDKGFKMLISLCNDDVSHAMELGRRRGHIWIAHYIESRLPPSSALAAGTEHSVALAVRVLLALAQHPKFIDSSFTMICNNDGAVPAPNIGDASTSTMLLFEDKISLEGLSRLVSCDEGEVSRAATTLVLKVLQVIHVYYHVRLSGNIIECLI